MPSTAGCPPFPINDSTFQNEPPARASTTRDNPGADRFRGETINLSGAIDGDDVSLRWDAPGEYTYSIQYREGDAYHEIEQVAGAKLRPDRPVQLPRDQSPARRRRPRLSRRGRRASPSSRPTPRSSPSRTASRGCRSPSPTPPTTGVTLSFELSRDQFVEAHIVEASTGRVVDRIYGAATTAGEEVNLRWTPPQQRGQRQLPHAGPRRLRAADP